MQYKQITVQVLTCLRCGYEWTPKIQAPKVCPSCKSHVWDKPPKVWQKPKEKQA